MFSGMRSYRRTLGPRFSEGARLLWLVLENRGVSISAAVAELSAEDRKASWSKGVLSNVLYGMRRPGPMIAADLRAAFGVPMEAWAEAPREAFVPPAARAAA